MRVISSLLIVGVLAACTDPGASHKADVFSADQVNQRQQLKTVTILSIKTGKVEVANQRNRDIAEGIGLLVGAVVGAAVGSNHSRGTQGAVLGAAAGAETGRLGTGSKKLVDGVQIIYREDDRVLQSAQVGKPCDYAPGMALVAVTKANETRIQSNHTCVKGQEMQVGKISNLTDLPSIRASDR